MYFWIIKVLNFIELNVFWGVFFVGDDYVSSAYASVVSLLGVASFSLCRHSSSTIFIGVSSVALLSCRLFLAVLSGVCYRSPEQYYLISFCSESKSLNT